MLLIITVIATICFSERCYRDSTAN